MAEDKGVSKPVQLWNQAVKAVKGDSAAQLVEQFTAEMTLIAEGLCEDQSRLRSAVEALRREQEHCGQSVSSEINALENTLREHQRDTDRRLDELKRRLDALDRQQSRQKSFWQTNWMNQAIVLAGIICGSWVLVTILNLFR